MTGMSIVKIMSVCPEPVEGQLLRDQQLEWSPQNVTPVKTGVQFRPIP